MQFRPLFWPSVFFVPAFAMMVALGVWQLERLQWKLELIATMQARLAAPELLVSSVATLAEGGAGVDYWPTAVTGRFDYAHELRWLVPGPDGVTGYHLLTPLIPEAGLPVIVDRGFVPVALTEAALRPDGPQTIHGVARSSQPGGLFTPQGDAARHLIYSRDVPQMAALMGLSRTEPFFIEAKKYPGLPAYPLGGQTQVQLRNEHLQYALTWFGLAGALAIVYLLYHRKSGRLG
jgi:surfeit locus 1 family protein